ncbi:rhomboid family intramembrane serine protease [Cellulomonas composti]|uniref:rhomboid family intramembrane serine protease n=1 Tax=Cellulomonas composti TaxID=266130 RepID=UPI0027D99ACC|nr:rhomboid family intramembrane serine protease [Cellulomonas composti]
MNEAAKGARDVRTRFGGIVHQDSRPIVTYVIIAACVAAYIAQLAINGFTTSWLYSPVRGHDEPWRFVTSAFLHSQGSFFHIVLNMVALWAVGPYLELQLGRVRFVTLYLLSAIGGSTVVLVTAAIGWSSWYQGVVGASGAIFGLFGATFVVMWRSGHPAQGVLGIIVVNMAFSFLMPGISWQGHLGGLLTGALLAAGYAFAPVDQRRLVAIVAPILLAVGLVVTIVWAYGLAPLEIQQIWSVPRDLQDAYLRQYGL